jgi:aminotransferase in exopolysaccharide biosynthesis
MIPLSVPNLKGNEKKYLTQAINTQWVSSVGKFVDKFEKKISIYTGAKYAIACSSGTAALHIALKIVGIKEGHEVIVPTMTFIATCNAIKYLNANPIFMDCDEHYNLDQEKLFKFLDNNTFFKNGRTFNKKTKRIISGILPVHVSGNAINIELLAKECKKKNIALVEDAAEALGTFYKVGNLRGKHAGTVGDLGCLSFNGNKIITSGGGGMIITNNKTYADKARYLTTQAVDDQINYIHNSIGYNYRLTNIQAAVGLAQLEKIETFLEKKKNIFQQYKKKFKNNKYIKIAKKPDFAKNNNWMISFLLNNNKLLSKLIKFLQKNKIQTRPMWLPNHLQKPYSNYQSYKISRAVELQKKTINLPCSTNLSNKNINKVVKVINNFFKKYK